MERFKAAFGNGVELPQPSERISLGKTHFSRPVSFEKFAILSNADFICANFENYVDFNSAYFESDTSFRSAQFESYSNFRSAQFERGVVFVSAHFERDTIFRAAHFDNGAHFSYAHFESTANFSSAKFLSITRFDEVEFKNSVPEFHATQLYEDTVFPASDKMEGHWPPVTGVGVMSKEDQKRAYNRLRLFMNKSQQIDEEMFFHRQEMACKAEIEVGLVRWLFRVYGAVSDYGSSVVKPLAGLGINLFVGWVGFLFYLNWANEILEVNPIWVAFGVSFSNIFAFFGFGRLFLGETIKALPDYMALLAASQTVFGFIFLFLLGLALRNRFRLR